MNLLEQLALAWQALAQTVRLLGRPTLWAPALVLGACELAVIGCLWWFAHPALSWAAAPLLRAVAGEQALHYPNLFRLLPDLYARADLVLGSLLAPVLIGAATLLFAARFQGRTVALGDSLGRAGRRAGSLILVNLPLNLLLLALSYGLPWWLALRGSAGLARSLMPIAILGGAVVLQALFLYVNALVMLEGRGPLGTLAALPRSWSRGFWAAFALGGVMMLPLLPLQWVAERANVLVDRGAPELVGWLAVVQVLVALLTWFVLTGAATLVFLGAVTGLPEEVEP